MLLRRAPFALLLVLLLSPAGWAQDTLILGRDQSEQETLEQEPDTEGRTAPRRPGGPGDGDALNIMDAQLSAGIRVNDIEVGHVLAMIAEQTNVSVNIAGTLDTRVTMDLPAGTTLRETLGVLTEAAGVRYVMRGEDQLLVMSVETFDRYNQAIQSAEPQDATPEEEIAPVGPLDQPLANGLRWMNVTLGEAAAQLAELTGLNIEVCPEYVDVNLRLSVGADTPLRRVLELMSRAARADWSTPGEGRIYICGSRGAGQDAPVAPQELAEVVVEGEGFTIDDPVLHVRGQEFFYKGRPVKLGGLSAPIVLHDSAFDMAEWLDLLALRGMNLTRVFLVSSWRQRLSPFREEHGVYNLTQYDDDFFRRLDRFLRLARERDIVVQLTLVEATQWMDGAHHERRQTSPMVRANNVQQIDANHDAACPWLQTQGEAAALLLALLDRTLAATSSARNVIYELCNVPPAGSENWHRWFAAQVKQRLGAAQGSKLVSINLSPDLDPDLLQDPNIDLYSIHVTQPQGPPAFVDKPCIVSTYDHNIEGDITPYLDAALSVPGGAFDYHEHIYMPHRYWDRAAVAAPVVFYLPDDPGPATNVGRFAQRLNKLEAGMARAHAGGIYPPAGTAPRRVAPDATGIAYYGELFSGQNVIRTGDYSTVGSVDLDALNTGQAARAVGYLRGKNALALLTGSGIDGLRKARATLDNLYRDGRQDAIANVWAVLLDVTDYRSQGALPLYANDAVRMEYTALIRQFQKGIRDVETPWGERPYSHIQSMLIVGPSTDADPAWGPWSEDARQGQLLPAELDIVGLRLPLAMAGDNEQVRRLTAAVQAGYPSLEEVAGVPVRVNVNGRPPMMVLVGTSAQADAAPDALEAAQQTYFDQARQGPFSGLLWWRYDQMPIQQQERLIEIHTEQGESIRGAR